MKYHTRIAKYFLAPNNEAIGWKCDLIRGILENDNLKYIILHLNMLEPNNRMQVVQIFQELLGKDHISKGLNPMSEYIFYNKQEIIPYLISQYCFYQIA